ncbi:MAG: hypothetical protein M3Q36_02130 [bacterium]|nr:hypothetical protein [bacterium]
MSQTIYVSPETLTPDSEFPEPEGPFARLNERYASQVVPSETRDIFGTLALRDCVVLDIPPHISAASRIQTNPSPVVLAVHESKGGVTHMPLTWVREEAALLHIGTTEAVPYYLTVNQAGKPSLHEFPDAQSLRGEDARVTPGVQMRSPVGRKPHTGWFISVVEATPKKSKPDEAESITQVGYWGERLDSLEPVCEIHGSKNTTIVPRNNSDSPLIDVFTRPFPHIAHTVLRDPSEINDNTVEEARGNIITKSFLPEGFHMGANNAQVSTDPRHVVLETHEARRQPNGDGRNALEYRLARAAFVLPTPELPKGKFVPLQVVSERNEFPSAEPKTSDSYVSDYTNILYGAIGQSDWIITGVGDNRLGAARLQRL